jgi:hypothetical protein
MNQLHKAVPSRERGAALIIVLAFVVLLTGVSIAYLSRTTSDRQVAHSSFNQSKVDQVAASAMDLVIGGLRQEITGPPPAPPPPYFPLPNANMLPLRFGTLDSMPNLVRRSMRGDGPGGSDPIPAPGYPSFASVLSSAPVDPANPKRGEITSSRWNKHYLVPRPLLADPTNTTPIADFVAPDWVVLTRNGPAAFSGWTAALADQTPANNSYAIGRYAYAVYDEGGLLDANVAGCPSGLTAAQSAAKYGPKGPSAFADMTALGMLQSDIDTIIGWRNYASAQPSGNFPSFNFNATSATNFVNFVLSNTNGFMTVGTTITGGGPNARTDQAFVDRQSLLQFRASSGFTADALQYLGTFSRELNAPNWAPTQDASDMGGDNGGGIYAYKTNAESSTAINRNLPNVLVTHSFVRADGTTAAVGDSIINRRFPLTRINGLADPTFPNTAPNSTIVNGVLSPATATTVQRDFGLLWDNANRRWGYVGASGSAVQSTIERLDQVVAENREPNFFELLKAVILSGSVGMGSGTGNLPTFVAAEAKYYDTTGNLSSDYQIIQIGTNIIDQWDSNNIPTFVNFGGNELAGIENLPYLNKLVFKPAWIRVHGNDQFAAWLVPSLWNPHQNAPPSVSQNVRIAMTTGTMTGYITSTGESLASTPITGSATQYMAVDASANWLGTSPSAPTTANPAGGSNITQMDNSLGGYYGFSFAFSTSPSVTKSNSVTAYPDFGLGCNFELQVQVSTSPAVWKAYQRWNSAGPNHPLVFQPPASSYWNRNDLQDPEFVTLDPRTLRFGVWGNAGNQSLNATDLTAGTQTTMDSPPVEAVTALRPQGGTWFNFSTSPNNLYSFANNPATAYPDVYYTDLDLVQRRGDFTTLSTTDEMQVALSTDRPLILNGAFQNGVFQSVAQLGHVFRDQPWKTLNFTTASPDATSRSADAGLLDVFTLHESSMEAGKTSLNTRHSLVLRAILSNAIKRIAGSSADLIAPTQRNNIITALTDLTAAQPMINKAELVTRLAADASVTGLGNKEARECVLRAFSDACQTRTWNLLIDVIAQSGRYPPNASSLAGFVVEGEQRYWVHVAIDRFTGQVIDKQIEVVNE